MEDPSTPNKGVDHTEETIPSITSETVQDEETYFSSFLSNGSSEHVTFDEADANTSTKTAAAIEHLNKKISRVKNSIRTEQTMRDGMFTSFISF